MGTLNVTLRDCEHRETVTITFIGCKFNNGNTLNYIAYLEVLLRAVSAFHYTVDSFKCFAQMWGSHFVETI